MSKTWGPTGIGNYKPVRLDEGRRQQIAYEIVSLGGAPEIPSAFFDALCVALGGYKSNREIANSSKPAQVRKNLKAALTAALELNGCLNNLDGNSRQLVSSVTSDGVSALQNRYLSPLIQGLRQAKHLSEQYPKKGRLPEFSRLWLAVDVADAIRRHLGLAPTTTRSGLFESVLTIILEVATGNEVNDVTALARKALKAQKVETPGLTEYIPPELN